MSQRSDHEREYERLSGMMRDPRYWRHREPDFVARVTEGFQRLFDTADAKRRAELGQAANASGITGRAHAPDAMIGHLAPGEIVIPARAQSKAVLAALRRELGDELTRFTVGSGQERRNPISGLPAFSPRTRTKMQATPRAGSSS